MARNKRFKSQNSKSPNPRKQDSDNEGDSPIRINQEIIDESKIKPLEIAIAALLMKTKSLNITERRKFVLNSVIQPRFMQYYFKPKYYKTKKDKQKRNASKVTTRAVSDYVDKFVVERFCNRNPNTRKAPILAEGAVSQKKKVENGEKGKGNGKGKTGDLKIEELESELDEPKMEDIVQHPKGVEFDFDEEMRKMRESEEKQREQEEEEWMFAESERRANSNCCVRLFRSIREWLQEHITSESFCLVLLNVIMVTLLAYAIQLLVVRFKFFADDIDHMSHPEMDEIQVEENIDIQIPVVD